jgi:hypothetical protein
MRPQMCKTIGVLMATALAWTANALAMETVQLRLSEHRFVPSEVTVPAGERSDRGNQSGQDAE